MKYVLWGLILTFSGAATAGHQCHSKSSPSPLLQLSSVPTDRLRTIEVSCNIKCQGHPVLDKNFKENFFPESFHLFPGDGSRAEASRGYPASTLWAMLTAHLNLWATAGCVQLATIECSGLEKIESVSMKNMSSSEWKYQGAFICKAESPIFSPFDDLVKTESNLSLASPLTKELPILPEAPLINYAGKADLDWEKKCQRKIFAKLCFGDCILDDRNAKAVRELLVSHEEEFINRDELTVCGDLLYDYFKSKKLSPSIKQHYCERAFFATALKKEINGYSCSSMRGEVDCREVLAP